MTTDDASTLVEVGTAATIELPIDFQATVQREVGRPNLYRYFTGAIILAITADGIDSMTATDRLTRVVSSYDGQLIEAIERRHVPGAHDAARATFTWAAANGDPLHSEIIVAHSDTLALTAHGAAPAGMAGEALRLRSILDSLSVNSSPDEYVPQ